MSALSLGRQARSPEVRALQTELQRSTLTLTVLFASVLIWLMVLLGNLRWGALPAFVLGAWAIVQFTCIVSYWLRAAHIGAAAWLLVGGLWLTAAASVLQSGHESILYVLAVVGIVASVLIGASGAIAVTLASTGLALALLAAGSISHSAGLAAIFTYWVAVGVNLIALNSLRQSIVMMHDFQTYAVEQMREARESRAQLAALTKALSETTENLEYTNAQLRHARQAAEEARRLKAQFAANVSHELRTPINLIVGFAEMMVSAPAAYGTTLPSAYWKDITTIHRNGKHLQGLINDVLDMSQIEAGQMAMVKSEVNLAQLLLEACDLIRDNIIGKGIVFEVEVPSDLPTIWLDRVRIRQVVLNLLGNAVRFTDQGRIKVQAYRDHDHVSVRVADTGVGVPPNEVNRVFEEFHQMESTQVRSPGGSGLGLTLSKQFIEMHGGQIWVESAGIAGKGSTFWFTLPYSDQIRLSSANKQRPLVLHSDDRRCVVVLDDDPVIRQLFERYTTRSQVLTATHPADALKLIRSAQPAALIMDERHADDAELCEGLAAMEVTPPVIRCLMPSGRRAMQLHGVADYLVKPVSQDDLERTLSRLNRPIHTILVIDDDQDIVRLYDRMLQTLSPDYQVRKAYGGAEGLAIMKRTPPDVVILDLLMPEMDGFGVIEAMKALPKLRSVPVVLASAYGASDAITPITQGELSVTRADGFQPIELVRCIETLVEALRPANAPA